MALPLYSDIARDDLLDIWLFIADDRVSAADRWLDTIDAECSLVADNPLIGRARPELGDHIRCLPVGDYIVYYLPSDGGVLVVRVLHGSRDVDLKWFEK
ncbi:MAG: type II toxin-antitoxin system RelE/ParE family toxin [Sedimentisphaerales bacterium]|nr:type II toxin-antitoxin system RelE/ParE family toxin [Sedimentisphaerales bacterium]MBN2842122.1 type II toxin-antitoxin system RelE/ParE family toxin [Sedimentisphaerales bacterium]